MKNLILFLIIILSPLSLYAQEAGVSFNKIYTDNPYMQDPAGFSVYYIHPVGSFGAGVSYGYYTNSKTYTGILGGGLIMPSEVVTETIESDATLQTWEMFGVTPDIIGHKNIFLRFAVGFGLDYADINLEGQTSGKTAHNYEDDSRLGAFYMVSAGSENIAGIPLDIYAGLKFKTLTDFVETTDGMNLDEGLDSYYSISFGVGYRF